MTAVSAFLPVYSIVDGHRAVNYWAARGSDGRALGAISRRTASDGLAYRDQDAAGWRALAYSATERPPNGNVDLGRFPTRGAAERALVAHLAERTEP